MGACTSCLPAHKTAGSFSAVQPDFLFASFLEPSSHGPHLYSDVVCPGAPAELVVSGLTREHQGATVWLAAAARPHGDLLLSKLCEAATAYWQPLASWLRSQGMTGQLSSPAGVLACILDLPSTKVSRRLSQQWVEGAGELAQPAHLPLLSLRRE